MSSIKLSKLLFVYLTVILFLFVLGYTQSYFLTSIGVPYFIPMLISLIIGLFLPPKLINWILKEELEAMKSEQAGEE